MRTLILSAAATVALAGAAAACPDYGQFGATYALTGSDLYSADSFAVTAGGGHEIGDCGFVETGYFTSAPDFTFDLSGMDIYRLELRVVSECDATLLVNSPTATWYFDDDRNGNLDPAIFLDRPGDGYLDVWVGTFDGASCPATLSLETF